MSSVAQTPAPHSPLAVPEWLSGHLSLVRDYVARSVPSGWDELSRVLHPLVTESPGPLAVLPLASCAAVGGDPTDAVPVAAAWSVLNVTVRILDDLQDRDRPGALWEQIGADRAFNIAAAAYTFAHQLLVRAPWSADQYRRINAEFIGEALRLAGGQDRDLRGGPATIPECWRTMVEKNARAFALACAAGAMSGSTDPQLVDCCRRFGVHLGLALQLFDDFEGLWGTEEAGDLGLGKTTLPVVYGLTVEHPGRAELELLAQEGRLAERVELVRALLDAAGAREFVIWTALNERNLAAEAIAGCPGAAGVLVLTGYVDAPFANVADLLSP